MLLVVYNRSCKVIWLFCSVVVMGFGVLAAVGVLSFGVFQSGCCLSCKIKLWYIPAGVVFASVWSLCTYKVIKWIVIVWGSGFQCRLASILFGVILSIWMLWFVWESMMIFGLSLNYWWWFLLFLFLSLSVSDFVLDLWKDSVVIIVGYYLSCVCSGILRLLF